MARRKGGSRRRKLDVLHSQNQLLPAALSGNNLIGDAIPTADTVLGENYRLQAMDLLIAWKAFTAGEGPIMIGIAHADYSDAEIEEWLEVVGQYTPDDLVAAETRRRLIRQIAVIDLDDATGHINDGQPVRVSKLGWMLNSGTVGVRIWAYNSGGGALTTGGQIHHTADWYGRWVF